jgi:hypothetical protein
VNAARAFLLLSSVLAVSACGSTGSVQPADGDTAAAPPPPIEAIDEPVPDAGFKMPPGDVSSSSTYLCLGDEGETDPQDCKATPDQAEKFLRMAKQFERAVQPARGTEPRAIARLRLSARGPNARVRLVVWRNQSDELCMETEVEEENGGSSDGPSGPCVPDSRCDKICLGLSASGSGSAERYLLSGVVASEADSLRMTLDDGRVANYALTGPVVPGFPKYRVFMLDLGRDLDRLLELRRDDKTIAEEKRSPVEIRMMRCEEDFPPALPSQDAPGEKSPLDQCLERAAPK